jgi:uncharacterized protein DUF4258
VYIVSAYRFNIKSANIGTRPSQLQFSTASPIIITGVGRGFQLAIVFSRHARRQMKWRRVSEAEVLSVLHTPDRVEQSIDDRRNAYKSIGDRLLKATYVEEEEDFVVITVIEKESVGG